MRIWLALLVAGLAACVTPIRLTAIADIAGDWKGRMSGPRGNAAAHMTVDAQGAYAGTMFLDGGDRAFHGRLVVVRPGEMRYQGSEGNGAARLYQRDGRFVLTLRGDDDGADGTFLR